MKKNGFTLIELLAVIVILAIIALIATPIILGIINDAREESNERSVELYASAVRNAIASYQLTGTKAPTEFSDLEEYIKYDGNVVCATEELYKDGSFYITDCTANGTEVEYTYGRKKYEPQYYYFGFDWSGTVGTTAAPSNPSGIPPEGKNFYLGYDVDSDNKVSTAYACFVRNNTEYCLKGKDTDAYATNVDIIKDAYSDVVDTGDCVLGDGNGESFCHYGGVNAFAGYGGDLYATDAGGEEGCIVSVDGYFECFIY